MVNVMAGKKPHMTDSNFLQLIIHRQGFPCFTVLAVTVFIGKCIF